MFEVIVYFVAWGTVASIYIDFLEASFTEFSIKDFCDASII